MGGQERTKRDNEESGVEFMIGSSSWHKIKWCCDEGGANEGTFNADEETIHDKTKEIRRMGCISIVPNACCSNSLKEQVAYCSVKSGI